MYSSRVPSDSMSTLSGPSEGSQSGTAASTASKRYMSAPFLLQGQLARRLPTSELVVVDTPPSHRANPCTQVLSPPLPLKAASRTAAVLPLSETAGVLSTRHYQQQQHDQQHLQSNAMVSSPIYGAATPVPLAQFVREASESSSTAATSNVYTPLTTASAPSMPYTWTDSYLDESPEATRTRWLTRQTFGPVLQSEGGASSTIASTPREPICDGEKVWGAVLDRNAQEREAYAATRQEGRQNLVEVGVNNNRSTRESIVGASRHPPRRFNLEAAERGGEGLGRPAQRQRAVADEAISDGNPHSLRVVPGASPTAKALFTASNDANHFPRSVAPQQQHLVSDVSTVIATVQQPRRGAHIAPVEKGPPVHSTNRNVLSPRNDPLPSDTKYGDSKRISSVSAGMLSMTCAMRSLELPVARDAPQSKSPAELNRISITRLSAHNGSSRSSSSTSNNSLSDEAQASASDLMRAGGARASRNGPLRRRVLRPLYDD